MLTYRQIHGAIQDQITRELIFQELAVVHFRVQAGELWGVLLERQTLSREYTQEFMLETVVNYIAGGAYSVFRPHSYQYIYSRQCICIMLLHNYILTIYQVREVISHMRLLQDRSFSLFPCSHLHWQSSFYLI